MFTVQITGWISQASRKAFFLATSLYQIQWYHDVKWILIPVSSDENGIAILLQGKMWNTVAVWSMSGIAKGSRLYQQRNVEV